MKIGLDFLTMNLPNRNETVQQIEDFYKQIEEIIAMTPFERKRAGSEVKARIMSGILLIDLLSPSFGRVSELNWRLKTKREATVAMIAILRYVKEKGEYPASLKQLEAAGYINILPMDPYSDTLLVYRLIDDNFILYSFGADFDDDGGTVSSSWGQGDEGGDQVFWPVN